MADTTYTPTAWNTGDVITADKLNHIEQGVSNEQVGPQGPAGTAGPKGDAGATGPAGAKGDTGAAGKDGASITALALTADSTGKITGGKATLSDKSTVDVTVTTTPAS